jgi:Cd2+/Zn2+-exporting ATPase
MGHGFFGVQKAEDEHHAHSHFHDHAVGHDHDHGDAAEAARWAGFWLCITLAGGILVLTSFYVQAYSPKTLTEITNAEGLREVKEEYLYQFHMDLVAAIGAILLGARIIWHAIGNLIRGYMHMDELVALAIVAAFAAQNYRAAGVIAFFLLLSELIETLAAIGAGQHRGTRQAHAKKARLVTPTGEQEVPATSLNAASASASARYGIPADGTVAHGESTVNRANITGESLPVDKRPSDPVFSGTMNLTGAGNQVTKWARYDARPGAKPHPPGRAHANPSCAAH